SSFAVVAAGDEHGRTARRAEVDSGTAADRRHRCRDDGFISSDRPSRVHSVADCRPERSGASPASPGGPHARTPPAVGDDAPQDGDDTAADTAAIPHEGEAAMKLKHRLHDIGDQLEELALAARAEKYQGVSMTFGAAQFSLSVPELL